MPGKKGRPHHLYTPRMHGKQRIKHVCEHCGLTVRKAKVPALVKAKPGATPWNLRKYTTVDVWLFKIHGEKFERAAFELPACHVKD